MQNEELKKKQEEIENYYDSYVGRQKNVGVNARHKSILSHSIEEGLKKTDTVLEIGCGIGTFSGLLIDYVNEGKVVSMDISGESIELAKSTYKQANSNFIHADATDYEFGDLSFDKIIMPDVIEHIPVELHAKMFEKLSRILKNDGAIFIHIPNPYYLQWCHENRTDLLQVIDQPITTDILVSNTYKYGLFIQKLISYSIWIVDNDYQFIVLRKNGYQNFKNEIVTTPTIVDKIKYKLKGGKK